MTAATVDEYRAIPVGHKPAIGPILTVRKREILQLVAEGWTSQEIGTQLCVSERTVATHRQHLAEELDPVRFRRFPAWAEFVEGGARGPTLRPFDPFKIDP